MNLKTIDTAMKKDKLTSEDLVKASLEKIKTLDPMFNTICEINPDAIKEARIRDKERLNSGRRSLLDGVPVLVKDNIDITFMATTAGSLALLDNVPKEDATLIKNLKEAGAIILGKANLSEFAYFMHQKGMPSGYSSRSGQVINPFGKDVDPLGSSTGSAVAALLEYTPVTIGTETSGSLMAPAYQTSTVSIKPTVGLISRQGIIPISHVQDTAGPMGLSVFDCAVALEVMKGTDAKDEATLKVPSWSVNYENAIHGNIKGLKVGLLLDKPLDATRQTIKNNLAHLLEEAGIIFEEVPFENVALTHLEIALKYEFKSGINAYLRNVGSGTSMTSLSDIIAYNEENKELCLKYGQDLLVASDALPENLLDGPYLEARKISTEQLHEYNELYQTYDVLLSFDWNNYGPTLGHPSIAVPAKSLRDKKPLSLIFMGPSFSEERLIALAHFYETKTMAFEAPILK